MYLSNSRHASSNRQIDRQLESHKKALKSTKSTLGSFKAPHPHIDYVSTKRKKKSRSGSLSSSFTNPEPSYITINGLTHQGFSFPVMTKKNKRGDEFIRNEHEKRCRILKEKVRNVGKSVQERKKNPYDYKTKPVHLVRAPSFNRTPALDTFDMQVSNDVWRTTYKPLGKLSDLTEEKVQNSFCFDAGSLYESSIRRDINKKFREWHRPKVEEDHTVSDQYRDRDHYNYEDGGVEDYAEDL
jgi:hypothetical protein